MTNEITSMKKELEALKLQVDADKKAHEEAETKLMKSRMDYYALQARIEDAEKDQRKAKRAALPLTESQKDVIALLLKSEGRGRRERRWDGVIEWFIAYDDTAKWGSKLNHVTCTALFNAGHIKCERIDDTKTFRVIVNDTVQVQELKNK